MHTRVVRRLTLFVECIGRSLTGLVAEGADLAPYSARMIDAQRQALDRPDFNIGTLPHLSWYAAT